MRDFNLQQHTRKGYITEEQSDNNTFDVSDVDDEDDDKRINSLVSGSMGWKVFHVQQKGDKVNKGKYWAVSKKPREDTSKMILQI